MVERFGRFIESLECLECRLGILVDRGSQAWGEGKYLPRDRLEEGRSIGLFR
jgi:hypothetical protein